LNPDEDVEMLVVPPAQEDHVVLAFLLPEVDMLLPHVLEHDDVDGLVVPEVEMFLPPIQEDSDNDDDSVDPLAEVEGLDEAIPQVLEDRSRV
jgi:hypothetical protein